MKQFISEIRDYGLRIALQNLLISFTKWFCKARRIRLTYFNG